MPFVGTGHMWLLGILLIIVLIIWGPGKLPDVGAGMGRAIREFRKASTETKEQFAVMSRPDGTSPVVTPSPDAVPQAAPAPSSPARTA
jgi:sec-independent protein translocase protein TatA